jgi:biotin operon repressor
MSAKKIAHPHYLIPMLSRALDIIELLQADKSPMTLDEVHRRTRFSRSSVYHVLQTLAYHGYVAKTSDGLYRLVSLTTTMRFGFGSQSAEMPFSEAVTSSLRSASLSSGSVSTPHLFDERSAADTGCEAAPFSSSKRIFEQSYSRAGATRCEDGDTPAITRNSIRPKKCCNSTVNWLRSLAIKQIVSLRRRSNSRMFCNQRRRCSSL